MTHSHQFSLVLFFFLDMDNDTTTKADFATEFCHPSDENEHSKHEVFDEDIWGKDEDFYIVADPIENPNGNPEYQPSRQYDKDFPMISSTSQSMDIQPLITNPRPHSDPQHENLPPVSLHNNSASSSAIKDPEIEYIILDTNVLILDLNYVLFIIRDFKQFKIFLPWQVLQEIGDLEKRPLPQLAQKARIAHSSLGRGPNPKVKKQPESIWNLVALCMLIEKKPILKKFYWWTFEIIQKFDRKMKNFEIFFDEHMDTSVIVNNIKKNFKIFDFLAKFFPWSAHAQSPKKKFFAKKFIFVHIFILDVLIYCQNSHLRFRISL